MLDLTDCPWVRGRHDRRPSERLLRKANEERLEECRAAMDIRRAPQEGCNFERMPEKCSSRNGGCCRNPLNGLKPRSLSPPLSDPEVCERLPVWQRHEVPALPQQGV